ncbi:MAG: sulfotransferase [Bacillota bacterium]
MSPEPTDLQARMQQAIAAHQQGDLDLAERNYRAVLTAEPRHADATHFLGLLLHQRGRSTEALSLMQRALQFAPGSPLFHNNLAGVYEQTGRGAEAEREYREALALKPDYVQAYVNLGMLYAARGDYPRALAEFERALGADPGNYTAWYSRAEALQELARTTEAVEAYGRAAEAAGDNVDLLLTVAGALREAGALAEARRCHARALALAPDYPPAENSMGNMLAMEGDLAEAETHYRRAIALKPDYAGAFHNLADVAKLKEGDPLWPGLMALAGRVDELETDDAVALHFTLGRVWEGQGQYPRAFGHFLEGNRLKRAVINYDEARQRKFFEDFTREFTPEFMAARRLDNADDRPVFIVGMPRSGTTLVEQILSSHPEVHGAGEVHALRNCLREELPPDNADYGLPEQIPGLDAAALTRVAARYGRWMDGQAKGARKLTNKLPGNMVFVGLIHLLYPQARVIHCTREPLDTCLSCFTKLFTTGHPFSYELGELGRFYRMYDRLMQGWRAALPGYMLELSYESLVADFDNEVKKLVAFCGLPWDEACLRFHESKRSVRTASLAQVRRPIYSGSVGRWKHYEKELEPLKMALSGT